MNPNANQENAIKMAVGQEGVCAKCGERCPHCNPKKGEEGEKEDEKFGEADNKSTSQLLEE